MFQRVYIKIMQCLSKLGIHLHRSPLTPLPPLGNFCFCFFETFCELKPPCVVDCFDFDLYFNGKVNFCVKQLATN